MPRDIVIGMAEGLSGAYPGAIGIETAGCEAQL